MCRWFIWQQHEEHLAVRRLCLQACLSLSPSLSYTCCDMCWHSPRISLRDVWTCHCCDTVYCCTCGTKTHFTASFAPFQSLICYCSSDRTKQTSLALAFWFCFFFCLISRRNKLCKHLRAEQHGSVTAPVFECIQHGCDISLQTSVRTNKQRKQAGTQAEDKTHKQQQAEHTWTSRREEQTRVCSRSAGRICWQHKAQELNQRRDRRRELDESRKTCAQSVREGRSLWVFEENWNPVSRPLHVSLCVPDVKLSQGCKSLSLLSVGMLTTNKQVKDFQGKSEKNSCLLTLYYRFGETSDQWSVVSHKSRFNQMYMWQYNSSLLANSKTT